MRVLLLLGFAVIFARWASADDTYKPKGALPTGPMEVEILSATDFKDVNSGKIYRLYGVMGCDMDQKAQYGNVAWPCGIQAMAWLVNATLAKWIICTPVQSYGEKVAARCATHDYPDVAGAMLKAGLLVDSNAPEEQAIPEYRLLQESARSARVGLWGSQFTMPWDWKKP